MSNKSSRPLWKLLLVTSNQAQVPQVTCGECFQILEFLAEMGNAPNLDVETLRKLAQKHLASCPDCREYYKKRFRQIAQLAYESDTL